MLRVLSGGLLFSGLLVVCAAVGPVVAGLGANPRPSWVWVAAGAVVSAGAVVTKEIQEHFRTRGQRRLSAVYETTFGLLKVVRQRVDQELDEATPDYEQVAEDACKKLAALLQVQDRLRPSSVQASWFRSYLCVWSATHGLTRVGRFQGNGPVFTGEYAPSRQALDYLRGQSDGTVHVIDSTIASESDLNLRPPDAVGAFTRVAVRAGPVHYCMLCVDAGKAGALDDVDVQTTQVFASQVALGIAALRYRSRPT